jgi:hypothetical protein
MAEKRRVVRTTLELPIELHAALKTAAERERRSLVSQMLYILERFVEQDEARLKRRRRTEES